MEELLTEDVLKQLMDSPAMENFIDTTPSTDLNLSSYLNALLDKKAMRKIDVIHASGLNETFGYQIFNGQRLAGRDKIIQLALGLHCSVRETQRLLKHGGVSDLYPKNRRDAIILFGIQHEMNVDEVDSELYRYGEETIRSK